ncbi:hypothetical protein ANO14919_083890 [Xylariales sp. No.14919]|nr:hypothetical protein ANO14919_083890 [Xylariales sp. No.14919]
MSTTMTMTLPPTTTATATTTATTLSAGNEPCCPNCGLSLPPPFSDPHTALLQAQRQIDDLQGQVRLLNQKATAAVDRWADYEDELSRLRAASTSTNSTTVTSTKNHGSSNNRPHTPDPSVNTGSPRSSFLGAGAASRISQLLSPRKSAAAAAAAASSSTPPPNATTQQRGSLSSVSSPALPLGSRGRTNSNAVEARELMTELARERRLRAAAEEKLAATSREVEDLSATLFEQANTMVATERRARAALEERLSEVQQRDEEKRARIGRLEGAVRRIERVRGILEDKEVEGKIEEEEDEDEGDGGAGKEGEKEDAKEQNKPSKPGEDNNIEKTDGNSKEGD